MHRGLAPEYRHDDPTKIDQRFEVLPRVIFLDNILKQSLKVEMYHREPTKVVKRIDHGIK